MATRRAPKQNIENVVTVGKGGDVEQLTTSAAVTAASSGAAADNRKVVVRYPGPDPDYTPVANVRVVDMEALASSGDREGSLREMAGCKRGRPFVAPYPAVIAIRCDDGDDMWETSMSNLGNTTPLAYAQARGIPETLAIIPDYVGNGTHVTTTKIKNYMRQAGFEMCGHGYDNHEAYPTSRAAMLEEVVRSRNYLEALQDGGSDIGIACRGWVQPGNWGDGGNWDVDTVAKADLEMGQLLRSNYEWSQCYVGGATQAPFIGDGIRHMQLYNFTLDATTTTAQIDQIIEFARTPGMKVCVQHHKIVNSGAVSSEINALVWKELIDKIYTAMTTTFDLFPVTLTGFYDAMLTPPVFTGGGLVHPMWPGAPGGLFEMATLAYSDWTQGCFVSQDTTLGGSAATAASAGNTLRGATAPWAQGNALRLTQGSETGHTQRVIFGMYLQGGYTYRLRWDMKSSAGTSAVKVLITFSDNTSHEIQYSNVPATWTLKDLCIGIPTWGSSAFTKIQIYTNTVVSTSVDIDNVFLVRS